MNNEEVYAIIDVESYTKDLRLAAANEITENNTDNLDEYISVGQMKNLVKNECLGFDGQNRPLLNEDINAKIFDTISIWLHNVGLAKLAAQDLIECAWDNESNEMVFWAKKKEQHDTKTKRKPGRKNPKNQKPDS